MENKKIRIVEIDLLGDRAASAFVETGETREGNGPRRRLIPSHVRVPARARGAVLHCDSSVRFRGPDDEGGRNRGAMNQLNLQNIDFNNPTVWIGTAAVLLLIVLAIVLWAHQHRKKSEALHAKFGAEYDLAMRELGSRRKAEARLMDRVHRVERFSMRDLTPAERERYRAEWSAVQARFVDHPRGAVTEADELVKNVMQARGFPAAGFDQRLEDISVHHARLVDSYRAANAIAARAERNEASTEELRTAMIHFRSLFDELLGAMPATEPIETPGPQLRRSA